MHEPAKSRQCASETEFDSGVTPRMCMCDRRRVRQRAVHTFRPFFRSHPLYRCQTRWR